MEAIVGTSGTDAPAAARPERTGGLHRVGVATMYRRAVFDEDDAARVVARAHGVRWLWRDTRVLAWVLLPDRWEALLHLGEHDTLPMLVGRFKGLTSRQVETRHRVNGWLWARGFSRRTLGDRDDPVEVARGLVARPVHAGLVARVGDYAYWDSTWLR